MQYLYSRCIFSILRNKDQSLFDHYFYIIMLAMKKTAKCYGYYQWLPQHKRAAAIHVYRVKINSLPHAACMCMYMRSWAILNGSTLHAYVLYFVLSVVLMYMLCNLLSPLQGCDLNLKNDLQQTALHTSSHEGHSHVIERLVGYGIDINAQDSHGNTALHMVLMKKSARPLSHRTPQMNQACVFIHVYKSMFPCDLWTYTCMAMYQ